MSGGSGPSEITPLPADGGVVKSSLWFRPPASEITPLPADGGVVKSSLWFRPPASEITPLPAGGGVVKIGTLASPWHIGSLRFGSTGPGW